MTEIALEKILASPAGKMSLKVGIQLPDNAFVSLYGPSGAGKTSVLRMVAGLIAPDRGRIVCGNEVWFDSSSNIKIPVQRRMVSMVFQDHALFPNMTVRENIQFAMTRAGEMNWVNTLMEQMELGQLQKMHPSLLSGGQKQRVALARALVRRPKLLLLDEPLSALDTEMRLRMQDLLKQVHLDFGLTTILVSHDMPEVKRLADYVYVMRDGLVERHGPPDQVLPLAVMRQSLGLSPF